MEKKEIRKELLRRRSALSDREVELCSKAVCGHLLKLMDEKNLNVIYGYMPIRREVDIRPALEEILRSKKTLLLPRVNGETMDFYRVRDFSDLEVGSFGVLEPKLSCSLAEPDGLVLVPGVGFDKSGARLGYGKGFYDKYFSSHKQNLYKIGIAYNIQIIEKIPTTPLDVLLDGVVCETGLYERVL